MRFGVAQTLAVQQPLSLRAFGAPGRGRAGIGTPVDAGTGVSGNTVSATPAIPTTTAVAIGDLFVMATKSGSSNAPSAADLGGEAMTACPLVTFGTNRMRLFWLKATAAHASGVSVTTTFGNANGTKLFAMAKVSGIAASPLDVESALGASGNSTSPSITTPSLAQALEILFCPLYWATASALTPDANFTKLNEIPSGGSSLALAFKKTAATTAVTYAPSLASASDWMATYAAFKGA